MQTSPSVSLCLACAASLPPRRTGADIYYTSCCSRPICPSCISANPRLARYNPCLRCLAGVKAIDSSTSKIALREHDGGVAPRMNVDGSVRDEDIFVVEDEDDSDIDSDGDDSSPVVAATQAKPAPSGQAEARKELPTVHKAEALAIEGERDTPDKSNASSLPQKYFVRPDDTLLGISLRFGVDGRILCRMNNLPVSTLRTSPHLLHTRSFLVLPPSASAPPPPSPADQALEDERVARLAIERAETRFQSMTKETDRDVARAYVALAGLHHNTGDAEDVKELRKEKEDNGLRQRRGQIRSQLGEGSIEEHATDQYYDDEEWEARERAEGRKGVIAPFPYFSTSSRAADKSPALGSQKAWWRWRG